MNIRFRFLFSQWAMCVVALLSLGNWTCGAKPVEPKPKEAPSASEEIDAQIEAALKADPQAAMLQQEIKTREYWLMQLGIVRPSPQFDRQEREIPKLEKKLAIYREKIRKELTKEHPFTVQGRVTDADGKPMEGVTVRVATGMGTLKNGGATRTDADGRYTLYFGPGMMVMEDYAPLGVGVQAAIILANKPGWYETNLNRQGDLLMSDQEPESLEKEDLWGRKSVDSVIFPNQPREVNFTLAPAAIIKGQLVGDGTWKIDNHYLSLIGEELPPASSVFTGVTSDTNGKFTMDAVPPGKPWQFRMRIDGTRGEVLTEPFTIDKPGVYRCVVSLDTETRKDGSVVLKLRQEAAETP